MGAAVGADQPGAVHGEAHRQILDRDVVDDLVVGALQEGRIDGAERPVALRGEAGGEGHRMLLGNADVEGAVGKGRLDLVEAGARRHRRGDRDDLLVARHFVLQRLGEHRGIGRRAAARTLVLLARDDVELDHAMIFVGGIFGRAIALALLGHDMDQDRAFLGVADILEDFDQRLDIMAVDRADIIEAQLLEQGAAGHPAAGIFLHLARGAMERIRHRPRQLLRQRGAGPDICSRRPAGRGCCAASRPAARSTCHCRSG